MVKSHKIRLEKAMLEIENSFPSHKMTTMKNLTYLLKPELLKELSQSQQSKILKRVSWDCIHNLWELHHVMQFLPKKQSSKVLTHPTFQSFMSLVQDFRFLDKKVENEYAQTLYSNFITIGLRGISNSMPRQFSVVVQDMVRPILQLLIAISETEIKGVPKLPDSLKKDVLGQQYKKLVEYNKLTPKQRKNLTSPKKIKFIEFTEKIKT